MTKYILNNDHKNWQPYVNFRSALSSEFIESNFKLDDMRFYDRFGIIENPPDAKIIRPFIAIQNNKTFDELCLDRCIEIDAVSKEQNKSIVVTWSGGLDSTCVLIAFMQTITNNNRLKVLCTKESIEEYPEFYESFIKGKYEVLETDWASFKTALNAIGTSNIIVTGELADQLFDVLTQTKYEKTPWQNIHVSDPAHLFRESRKGPWQIILNPNDSTHWGMVETFVEKFPKKINNLRDFLHAFRLNYRYQIIQTRMIMMTDDLRLEDNIFHFFDTNEFNNFSIDMDFGDLYDEANNITKTKKHIREFICKFTHDFEYYNTKTKSPSLGVREYPLTTRYTKLDEDWNRYV
jgi:hypothetical protein